MNSLGAEAPSYHNRNMYKLVAVTRRVKTSLNCPEGICSIFFIIYLLYINTLTSMKDLNNFIAYFNSNVPPSSYSGR